MPLETPPDSRVQIIRNPDRAWVPSGTHSLPPHCTVGMPYAIAAALAAELNRCSMDDPDRAHSWHVVISRQNKSGYAVMRVLRSANWIPRNEFDLPPDAGESMFNMEARKSVQEFNRREMKLSRSPEFWAVLIKPLKKELPDRPKLEFSRNDTRIIRVNGRRDVQVVVQGVSCEREALHKLREAVSPLFAQ